MDGKSWYINDLTSLEFTIWRICSFCSSFNLIWVLFVFARAKYIPSAFLVQLHSLRSQCRLGTRMLRSLLVNTILYHYKEALISKNNSWFFYIFLQCLRRMHLPRLLRSHQGTIIYQNMTKCRDISGFKRWWCLIMPMQLCLSWWSCRWWGVDMRANEIIKDEILKRLHETAKLYEW